MDDDDVFANAQAPAPAFEYGNETQECVGWSDNPRTVDPAVMAQRLRHKEATKKTFQ